MASQAQIVNQRSPKYQAMMDAFGNLSSALAVAEKQARTAQRNNVLQGYDYKKLEADIAQIKSQVDLLLTARQQRYEYQTLTPNSIYFRMPPALQGAINGNTKNGEQP